MGWKGLRDELQRPNFDCGSVRPKSVAVNNICKPDGETYSASERSLIGQCGRRRPLTIQRPIPRAF
jgi:hypothetical protein